MVSPRAAILIPSGPSRTAVPSRTSTTVQPGMVVGLVSGAGANDGFVAIATAAGLVLACEAKTALAAMAEGFGMLPTVAGAAFRKSGADAVFLMPSVLPGFASAMAGEGTSFCAIWSTPIRFATSGQCSAPAHPSAKLTASAMVASRRGRARSLYGSRSTSTSSRVRLKRSGRPAGFLGNDQM